MFDVREPVPDTFGRDPLAQMRDALAAASAEDSGHWSGDDLSTRLIELIELRERLDAEMVSVAAQWRRTRAWEADGSLSPVAWLTHRAPLTVPDAQRLVKTAKIVDRCPEIAARLADGRTTSFHVEALANVVSPRREELVAEHDATLADQAERLSIKDFTTLVRRWAAMADDHLAADTHDSQQPHNELHAAVTINGWVDGTFRLDPISGARLLNTLDQLAPPDPVDAPDGVRSLSWRRGDALADLAGWYHRGAEPGANPPNLDVVVDVATLNGDTPELAQIRCDLDGVGPVTRGTLEQIGCEATVTRMVMAGTSVVLDMGRKSRFATPAQRRAIVLRDGGCIFPSCDRPHQWCDIHHVDGFAKGGRTDIARMVCLCARHHTLIHNSKWTISTNPDGTFSARHPTRAP
jgi:hypothetical protein